MPATDSSVGKADAIVVGSGIGGLTVAALLAKLRGMRVLVLEQHFRVGGYTHTFSRPGGFRWDVGIHYVGEVADRGLIGDVCRSLTGGDLAWARMEDPFERLVFPGFEFAIRSGRSRFADDLVAAFPAEAKGIRRWLGDLDRASRFMAVVDSWSLAPAPARWAMSAALSRAGRLAATTTRVHLEATVRDPKLRAVLGARWGDYGLPPSASAMFAHAMIVRHYFGGAAYPVGSAARIAETIIPTIERAGGSVRVRARVSEVSVEAERVRGVRLDSGEELWAPLVISDAGARNTYLRLLRPEVPIPFRDEVARAPRGAAYVSLYLGLSASPASLGVRGENFWIHAGLDHDALWAARDRVLDGCPPVVFVSFPSLKDPHARVHTAQISSGVDAGAFARWAGTRWMRRGDEYAALKETIAEGLLETAERRLPGLRSLVVHRELSTPISAEKFGGHPDGEMYGIPFTPERLRLRWLQPRTPVAGLFLTGADALVPGMAGAMMGGVISAAAILGTPTVLGTVLAAFRRRT